MEHNILKKRNMQYIYYPFTINLRLIGILKDFAIIKFQMLKDIMLKDRTK